MVKRLISSVIAGLFMFGAGQVLADEVIASHEGLTATVIGSQSCAPLLRIVVDAPSGDVFAGDKSQLSVLLKAVRTRLAFDCEQAEDVLIEGQVEGQKIYRGAFSKGTDWVLVDLSPPKTVQSPPKKQEPAKEAELSPEDKSELMSLTLQSCETKYKTSGFCICAME